MMVELKAQITKAVDHEKCRADVQYGDIRTDCEGAGILAEELCEFVNQAKVFMDDTIGYSVVKMINAVRIYDYPQLIEMLTSMESVAVNASCEAVQVAAVCRRFRDYAEKQLERREN